MDFVIREIKQWWTSLICLHRYPVTPKYVYDKDGNKRKAIVCAKCGKIKYVD
jgi:hypothetical protein